MGRRLPLYLATKAFQALGSELRHLLPNVFTDKPLAQIQKHGLYSPPDGGWGGPFASWMNRELHGPHAGVISPISPQAPRSHAPIGAGGGGPVPVVVHGGHVNVANPRDLTTGVVHGMARSMNRPPGGYTGVNPTVDPQSAYFGMTPP